MNVHEKYFGNEIEKKYHAYELFFFSMTINMRIQL